MSRIFRFWWLALVVSVIGGFVAVLSDMELDRGMVLIRTRQDVRVIQQALELFEDDLGRYPTIDEGLSPLVGRFLRSIPRDAWQGEYVYVLDRSGEPTVYSMGANHIDEGGLGDDIVGGEKAYRCEDYVFVCPRGADVAFRVACGIALASLVVGIVRGALRLWGMLRRRVPAA